MNFQRHMIAVIFYELIRQKIVLNVYLDTCIYLGNIIRKYANTQKNGNCVFCFPGMYIQYL